MANIKDMNRIAAKWERVAGGASGEYLEGVENPKADWEKETSAAEKTYEAGIQASIGRKAFGKGVKKAGTAKWQDNARTKGPQRYAQGIALSKDAYANGFAPYAATIASVNLPARGPKGDPSNLRRVELMATALHKKKLELEGK